MSDVKYPEITVQGLIFPKSFQEKKINYLREKTSSFQQHCYEVFYA